MATVQTTNVRVKIEPTDVTPEMEYGPSDYMPHDAVLMTAHAFSQIGSQPPRSGEDFDCHLWVYDTVAGAATARTLDDYTVTATYWDPVSLSATALTVAKGAGAGQLTVSWAASDTVTAGMYRFSVEAVETDAFTVCSGWLEIMPATPSP
jgi:hypothetical protein